MRRSTRLRVELSVHVRSLDPKFVFEADCRTLIVNAQGCGIQCPRELPRDTILLLSIGERQTTGSVLNSTSIGPNGDMWVVGIELHEGGNFWGLPDPPADWLQIAASVTAAPAETAAKPKAWPFAKKRAAKVPLSGVLAKPPAGVPVAPPTAPAAPAVPPAAAAPAAEDLHKLIRQEVEGRVSAQWEQWRSEAETRLTQIQEELRKNVAAAASEWRCETQRGEEKLAGLSRLSEGIEAKSKALMEELAGQLEAGRQHLIAELKSLAGEVHANAADTKAKAEEVARAQAEIKASQKTRAEIEAQIQALSEESLARLTGEAQARLEAAVSRGLQQLQQQLREMGSQGDADHRRRMVADFEKHEKEFLDAVRDRVQDVSSVKAEIRSLADQVTAELHRHSEQSMAGLRTHVEELISRHEAELTARLSDSDRRLQDEQARRVADMQAAADRVLQAIDEHQSAAAARQAELTAAAEAALESIDSRKAQLESAANAAVESLQQRAAAALQAYHAELDAREKLLESTIEQRSWDQDAQTQAALERLDEKLSAALDQVDARVEQQTGEHLRAAAESAATAVRQSLQGEFEQRRQELRRQQDEIASALTVIEEHRRQLSSQLNDVQQAKSYIESVVASLPATVAQHARQHATEAAAEVFHGVREQSEKHIAETLQRESQKEAEQVREMLGASARQLREEMAKHAQKTAAELQTRIDAVITERERDLESRSQAFAAAADERLRRVEHELGSEFTRRMTQQFESERSTNQVEFEKSREAAEKLFLGVAERSDRLLSEVHASLQEQARELVEQELARAKREMQSGSAAVRSQELATMREELERVAAEQVNRAITAAAEAARSAEQLKISSAQTEAQSQALYQQLEIARAWLTQESESFQQNVHDAFLKASGEIRGRAHAAIEMADEFIQQKARETLAKVDAATGGQTEQLERKAEEIETRFKQMETTAAEHAEALLQARLAQTLEGFHQDASRLAESAIARWQTAMDETLRAMPNMLRRNLEEEPDNPPRGKGAAAGKIHDR